MKLKPIPTYSVYVVTHGITGQKYYGSTKDTTKGRWAVHQMNLDAGAHPNPYLQRDFDKDGDAFFISELMGGIASKEIAKALEDALIAADPGCYNIVGNPERRRGELVL